MRPSDLNPPKIILLCGDTVLLVELVNTTTSLRLLLLTCIERMALGADLNVEFLLRRTRLKRIAAVACYRCLIVLGMNTVSHHFHLFRLISIQRRKTPVLINSF